MSIIKYSFVTLELILLHQAVGHMGIMNPLYVYPTSDGLKDYSASASAGINQIFIMNPGNGDTNKCPPNSDWLKAIHIMSQGKDVHIVGYVHSGYGARDLNQIYPEINNYFNCWNVTGIFVDEAANDASKIGYYEKVYKYVKDKSSKSQVVLNPGTNVDEGYMEISDTVCIFESPFSSWSSWKPDTYVSTYPSEKFCVLSLETPSSNNQDSFIGRAASLNIGYVGAVGPNQANWNRLNTLWNEEVSSVKKH